MRAQMRNQGWVVAACLMLAACSGGGVSHSADPAHGQDAGGNDSAMNGAPDGGGGGTSGQNGTIEVCTPRTCAELGANCGFNADGCGGIINCGQCGQDEMCGLFELNVCGDVTTVCTVPKPSCGEHECGLIGDGCRGSVDCGTCKNGKICGLNEPFKCAAPPPPDTNNCAAKIASCAEVGASCGKIGNGCGGVIDCDSETGGCKGSSVCGLSTPSVCSEPPVCTPILAATACAGTCGKAANGCGGIIDCETAGFGCPGGQRCGGAGVAGVCGTPGSQTCTPIAAAIACHGTCGKVGNGCGAVIDCEAPGNGGTVCTGGKWCGGGGVASQCGEPVCTKTPMVTACTNKCGKVADGCGGLYDCAGCSAGKLCGWSTANVCGTPVCQPKTATTACAGKCGMVGDGCGGAIDCSVPANGGTICSAGTWCGGGGAFNTCGKPACTAKTCAELGYSCGAASDGCGGVLDCGGAAICGVFASCIGIPAACVNNPGGEGAGACPLCPFIPNCSGKPKTVLTGRVTTPDGEVGVPNAYVYILKDNNATLPTISEGVAGGSCERCEDEDLGPLLASSLTDHKGGFRIETNVPVGTAFTVVVKAGKWRRAALVPANLVKSCATTALPESYSRLPANSNDGLGAHLPKIAISTGWVDEMECVFYKAGIDAKEFTVPSGNGRLHMYRSTNSDDKNGQAGGSRMGTACTCNNSNHTGSCATDTTVDDSVLFSSQVKIDAYDLVVFDCEGAKFDEAAASDARVREYVNKGGRLFASHWSYSWLYDNNNGTNVATKPWETGLSQSAVWTGTTGVESDTAYLSVGRPRANTNKVQTFAKWLKNENQTAVTVTTNPATGDILTGEFAVTDPRDLAKSANVGADEWVYRTWQNGESRPHAAADTTVQQLSFNTPFGASAANVCGRVAYSGFHVASADNNDANDVFPCVCDGTTLTTQEKVLLYMLFDLGACVSTDGPPVPPSCTPATSQVACNGKCGYVSDGCGGVIDCGLGCGAGKVCNSTTNLCVEQCNLQDCADVGANCGYISDGCGDVVDCGKCIGNQVCGLNQPNLCGTPSCTLQTDASLCNNKCGPVSDGCGGIVDCGGCATGQVCGGGGPSQCGTKVCTPLDCATLKVGCGMSGDGCEGIIDCGPCALPDTCGGGGVASQCGHPTCSPLSCATEGAECGFIGDGCGGAEDCGPCPNNGVCGAAGPNICSGSCVPLTCGSTGAECGLVGDGCGKLVSCGTCPNGKVCGAEAANKCGDGPSCTPRSCAAANAECGVIGDGCGAAINCGKCEAPLSCGGAGVPNECGDGGLSCVPRTCESVGAECGPVGDGCGALLDCGPCLLEGETCGGGGEGPNKCGKFPVVI